jgi:hypothetical protein
MRRRTPHNRGIIPRPTEIASSLPPQPVKRPVSPRASPRHHYVRPMKTREKSAVQLSPYAKIV